MSLSTSRVQFSAAVAVELLFSEYYLFSGYIILLRFCLGNFPPPSSPPFFCLQPRDQLVLLFGSVGWLVGWLFVRVRVSSCSYSFILKPSNPPPIYLLPLPTSLLEPLYSKKYPLLLSSSSFLPSPPPLYIYCYPSFQLAFVSIGIIILIDS